MSTPIGTNTISLEELLQIAQSLPSANGSANGSFIEKIGTFTTPDVGTNVATMQVDCGFAPDAVQIFISTSSTALCNLGFIKHDFDSGTSSFLTYTSYSGGNISAILTFTDYGFEVMLLSTANTGEFTDRHSNKTFDYYAVKYSDANAESGSGTESGGGVELPSGYAMECGVYVPASDVKSYATIELENTYYYQSNDIDTNTFAYVIGIDNDSSSASVFYAMRTDCYFTGDEYSSGINVNSSGTHVSGATVTFGSTGTTNTIRIKGTTSYPLKAGIHYLWIVAGKVA